MFTAPDNRLELALLIDDYMTLEDVKKAWAEISVFRDALLSSQGPQYSHIFIRKIKQLREQGERYKSIAGYLNQAIIIYLCSYVMSDRMKRNPHLEWHGQVYEILRDLMVKKTNIDINTFTEESIKEIENNQLPFIRSDYPIDWMRVRDALRQWDKNLEKGKFPANFESKWDEPLLLSEFQVNSNYLPGLNLFKKLENIG